MKIHLSVPDSAYFVRRYENQNGNQILTLNNTDYFQSLCVHKDYLLSNLAIKSIHDLFNPNFEDVLEKLSERNPQVFLLGVGKTQDFQAQSKLKPLLKSFIQKQIGIEMMSTEAAARTYNILAQEGRDAMALFIL